MAITTARRRGRAVPAISVAPEPDLPPEPLPIGLPDLNVTSCPNCSRPIAVGTGKCPGCGTRLLLGVPAKRAGTFVVLGLVIGLLFGGGSAAVAFGRGSAPGGAAPGGVPVPPPSSGALATPATSTATLVPTPRPPKSVPAQAAAALGQALVINDRLASRAAELHAELGARTIDTFAVATTLRGLTADAVIGSGMTARIGSWSDGAGVSARLATYYRLVGSSAGEALAASLTDVAAYRSGATSMLRVLAGLPALDAAAEALATEAGVALPSPSTP
jgi:hypothetical protein